MKKIIYDYMKSVKENAAQNGCAVSTIYKYLQREGIDRHGDEQRKRYLRITHAAKSKKIKDKLAEKGKRKRSLCAEVAKEVGVAPQTVKRYLDPNYDWRKQFTQGKRAHFDNGNNDAMIRSIQKNQNSIMKDILELYVKDVTFDADFTYSKGNFYKKIGIPRHRYDMYPQKLDVSVEQLEGAKDLPNDSLRSVIVDLPFVVKKGRPTGKIQERFMNFETKEDMFEANRNMMDLAWEKLMNGGYLIMKTQDTNSAGEQIWVHKYIEKYADEKGFEFVDMFILEAEHVILSNRGYEQRHARKFHSYFYVFRKPKKVVAQHKTETQILKEAA